MDGPAISAYQVKEILPQNNQLHLDKGYIRIRSMMDSTLTRMFRASPIRET
jgi:hypothetical protein